MVLFLDNMLISCPVIEVLQPIHALTPKFKLIILASCPTNKD